MCFRKREASRRIIRKPESAADIMVEIVEEKSLRADRDTFIVVPQGFYAIVAMEGSRKKIFCEGTHRVDLDRSFGDTQGRVVYVNCGEIMTIFWGTEQYDYIDDILAMPIKMSFRGSAKLRVSDADKFIKAMLGNKSSLTINDIDEYFTAIIATHVTKITADVMIAARISYVEYATHILDITERIKESLHRFLDDEYGIDVSIFTIEPPFYADRRAMENLASDLERRRRLAFTEKESESVVNTHSATRYCSKCGSAVNAEAMFCPKCGARLG